MTMPDPQTPVEAAVLSLEEAKALHGKTAIDPDWAKAYRDAFHANQLLRLGMLSEAEYAAKIAECRRLVGLE